MTKKSVFIAITTLAVALLVFPSQTAALTLTPTFREVNLTPGQKSVVTVEIENEGNEAVELTTEVAPFTAKGETGEPEFNFDVPVAGAVSWVEVEEGPFSVAAGATKEIDVVFNTPSTATPGGYYIALFFTQTKEAEEDGDVTIESKLGTLFLITAEGSYSEAGNVSTFSATGESMTGDSPVTFSVKFQNTGDIHLKPVGTIAITDLLGNEVETITVNSEKGAVLPDSIREFEAESWTPTGFLFGKYTATLTFTAGTVSDTATMDFWFFSVVGIVVAAAVIIVIILLIVLIIKKAGGKKPEERTNEQENA
ncbi:hypothetical protein ACFL0L_00580 [Patescibacteria group bacterium]